MSATEMSAFEVEKRRRNLADGFKETKGLKDGHCNRRACQKPLADESRIFGERYSMRDHETFSDARLYYCGACAIQFMKFDSLPGRGPQRITIEVVPSPSPVESAHSVHL